jgi:hypothetical protein
MMTKRRLVANKVASIQTPLDDCALNKRAACHATNDRCARLELHRRAGP